VTPKLMEAPTMDAAPSHWAPAGAPLSASPRPGAPLAGGDGDDTPYTSKINWDWECATTVTQVGPTPPGSMVHRGGCHCGLVRFECEAAANPLVCYDCNCSDCRMRRNVHFVVPSSKFKLIQDEGGGAGGSAALAEYRWKSGVARHLFCSRCGITPFYRPRSNPDGWAITFQCLDPGTVASVEVRHFDGQHWEEFIAGAGASIRAFSKQEDTGV